MPNFDNAKTAIEARLKEELHLWETGQRRWGFSNQFDRSVLESALKALTAEAVADLAEKFGTVDFARFHVMDLAHTFSEFKAPEIDYAWID